MIFFAVLAPALFGTAGIAIEGGRVFVEYRRVQAAADMAAIVGAQALPCTTSNSGCVAKAETQACDYASKNGFSGCTAGGTTASAATANVPPLSCSPYDFIDYGNGSNNAKCKSSVAPTSYYYIEVKLSNSLGTVPIFNIPVTLSAHAVARKGPRTSGDFAIMTLDPNTPLNMGGNATVQVVGSVFGQGGVQAGGSAYAIACQGGWYAADGGVNGVNTNSTGSVTFAPAGCSAGKDTSPNTVSGVPEQNDPYAGGSPPPVDGSFPNCTECTQAGWWYDLSKQQWKQGGDITGTAELFPGKYGSLDLKNSTTIYFNPGVYTFTGDFYTEHATMCVYGAPDCNDGNQSLSGGCSQTAFNTGTTLGDQWYAACSPYGYFDTNRPANGPQLDVPTFTDGRPLNGVTIYLPSGSGGLKMRGNGGKDGKVYLAAPNPCPGTGTSYTAGSLPAVSMPAGSVSGTFSYLNAYTQNNFNLPRGMSSSTAGTVYPSYDFSLQGECNSTALVWANEMVQPQHLHFVFYDLSTSAQKINGASSQNYTGIMYAPKTSLSVLGAGKGGGGTPWIDGQLITNDISFSGSSYDDVSYRPCAPGPDSCGSGLGTQLVQ